MKNDSRQFVLGRCVITPLTRNRELQDAFRRLLCELEPAGDCSGQIGNSSRFEVVMDLDQAFEQGHLAVGNIADSASDAIVALLGKAISGHESCLWLDAATLISPDGRLVMLSGPSLAGKTTLSIAMYLAHNWKAYAEDVTLIDLDSAHIIPFARPSSLREGSAMMLERACGRPPDPLMFGQWFFDRQMFESESTIAKYAVAVRLEPADADVTAPVVLNAVSPHEFVRSMLPLSNLLRKDSAIGLLTESVGEATCFVLSGGSLEDRIASVLQAAGQGLTA